MEGYPLNWNFLKNSYFSFWYLERQKRNSAIIWATSIKLDLQMADWKECKNTL